MARTPAKKKSGRPRNGGESVRISPRFSEHVAESLRRASALRGISVTAFVVESAQKEAERVIEEETRWRLDEDETARLTALLRRPPRINVAARKAQALAQDVQLRS